MTPEEDLEHDEVMRLAAWLLEEMKRLPLHRRVTSLQDLQEGIVRLCEGIIRLDGLVREGRPPTAWMNDAVTGVQD